MAEADGKDVQAFNELQRKLIDLTEKQKMTLQQAQTAQQLKRRAELTAKELETFSEETPTYRATGKAYFLMPKQQIMSELQSQASSNTAEMSKLNKAQESIIQSLSGVENDIRELLQSSQRLSEAFAASQSQ